MRCFSQFMLNTVHVSHFRTVDIQWYRRWRSTADITIPPDILTSPNLIVIILRSNNCTSIFELTIPYEIYISKDYNYKYHKYTHLVIDLNNCGFKIKFFAMEIRCRGLFSENNSKRLHAFYHYIPGLNSVHQILDVLENHFVKQ